MRKLYFILILLLVFLTKNSTCIAQKQEKIAGGLLTAFKKDSFQTNINTDTTIKKINELQSAVVYSQIKDIGLDYSLLGRPYFNISNIEKLPEFMGEKDIFKTLQLLPGVKSSSEVSNGYFVRGGSQDQNLILLDGAPVYNPTHMLGFFSIFNNDIINDANFYKGNQPAEYGGRLSSLLAINSKEGNLNENKVVGGIGLITSRIMIEGPLEKNKSSILLSARKTYVDYLLNASEKYKENSLGFYDLNFKYHNDLNNKYKLSLSAYMGNDQVIIGNSFRVNWGNKIMSLVITKIANPTTTVDNTIIYSNFDFNTIFNINKANLIVNSNITDLGFKHDYTNQISPNSKIKYGVSSIFHKITPGTFLGSLNTNINKAGRDGLENALYINNDLKLNPNLLISFGIRVGAYSLLGGENYNVYDSSQYFTSIDVNSNSYGKTYFSLEPRLNLTYSFNEFNAFKMALTKNVQHLHLLNNNTTSGPSDQWIGDSYGIKPEIAHLASIGFEKLSKNKELSFQSDLFYKYLSNQIDYKNGVNLNTVYNFENAVIEGIGRAYGIELIFSKRKGRLNGWISYTLSKTERKISSINENEWYSAKQDRLHGLSLLAIYELNKKISFSGIFVFNTGDAVTFPIGKYNLNDQTIYQYGKRNQDRMPNNHRLDLSVTYVNKSHKKYKSSWNFTLYNIYGQENPFKISFVENENKNPSTQVVQTSLFRWVPSISYNFSF